MNTDVPEDGEWGTELHPSLEDIARQNGLDPACLAVGLAETGLNYEDPQARERIYVVDGNKSALWIVPSLRALFRGDKTPLPMPAGRPPEEYLVYFHFIEQHVLLFCDNLGDKTDREFEEAFSQLRRRPDGRIVSHLHFFLWQVAACLVGCNPLSAAEFEGIIGRLVRSASTFRMGVVSRNYIDTLRQTGGV